MHALLRVLATAAGVMIASQAHATLGEKIDSGSVSQSRLVASTATITQGSYTDNARTLESGVVIHEYSRADGTVFAVAWKGKVMPDMKELLGTYFSQYIKRDNSTPQAGGLSQLSTTGSDLVVSSSGRLGAFSGLIYVPSLVPAGVDVEHLQ